MHRRRCNTRGYRAIARLEIRRREIGRNCCTQSQSEQSSRRQRAHGFLESILDIEFLLANLWLTKWFEGEGAWATVHADLIAAMR
jgi:hypothetical protein